MSQFLQLLTPFVEFLLHETLEFQTRKNTIIASFTKEEPVLKKSRVYGLNNYTNNRNTRRNKVKRALKEFPSG